MNIAQNITRRLIRVSVFWLIVQFAFAGSALAQSNPSRLILDFGSTDGLWCWTQAGAWDQLNTVDPDLMTAVDTDNDGQDELFASFSGYGLYIYDAAKAPANRWTQINTVIPENMMRLRNGIVLDFGATYGLWYWSQAGGWESWNNVDPDKLIAADIDGDSQDELIGSFSDYGLYVFDPDNAPANRWIQINTVIPGNMMPFRTGIACDFGATYGLWYWSQATGWEPWNSVDPDKMIAADIDGDGQDELFASFDGYGLYVYDPDNAPANRWTQINTVIPESMMRFRSGIVLDFGATHGLWHWTQAGGWESWNTADPDKMGAADIDGDGQDELIISFDGYGLYVYDPDNAPANRWTQINTVIPDAIKILTGLSPVNRTISIASFNIRTFGPTKASKDAVMAILAATIQQYDVVAIQEIRDSTGSAIEALETKLDSLGSDFDYIIGPRLGRTASYKEQYAFMYRTDRLSPVASFTFDDQTNDLFEREPFIAEFNIIGDNFNFVLANIHTDPDFAATEIGSLPLVVDAAKNTFPGENEIIVLGDFNADCDYFDEDGECLFRTSEYNWLISDEMDTNVAATSCTYDRIVMLSGSEFTIQDVGVFRFDTYFQLTPDDAKSISDHYPVFAILGY